MRFLSFLLLMSTLNACIASKTKDSLLEGDRPGECADDLDNDSDGLIDCDDDDCVDKIVCIDGYSFSVMPVPSVLNFGEIDFYEEMPDNGYNPMSLEISNTGGQEISLELVSFDFEHLCLQGGGSVPVQLSMLSPGTSYTLVVSVCDYIEEAGERNQLISDSIEFSYDAEDVLSVPWSFTPVLSLEKDSGN